MLKDSLTSATLLTLSEGTTFFGVYFLCIPRLVAVCSYATCKIYSQCFLAIKVHEKNYPTTDVQLAVVVFVLKI